MRPLLAVSLGFAATLVLSTLGEIVLDAALAAPDGSPLPLGRTFLSATLAVAFAASVVGGFIAAQLARSDRLRAALGVAALSAALLALSALDAPADAPSVIAWALPVLAFVGAASGGAIRANVRAAPTTTAVGRDPT